jgi:hypothetical protein
MPCARVYVPPLTLSSPRLASPRLRAAHTHSHARGNPRRADRAPGAHPPRSFSTALLVGQVPAHARADSAALVHSAADVSAAQVGASTTDTPDCMCHGHAACASATCGVRCYRCQCRPACPPLS